MTLSGRDEQRLREAVKRVEAITPPAEDFTRPVQAPLPRLAKAKIGLAKGILGPFILQADTPNQLVDGSTELDAYAFCGVKRGQVCLLHRCVGESSKGFWVAMPCSKESEQEAEYDCDACTNGKMPELSLTISGLLDTGQDNFDGWAAKINGTHTLRHETDILGVEGEPMQILPCEPGVQIAVPDNTATNPMWTAGPFAVKFRINTFQNRAGLVFTAGRPNFPPNVILSGFEHTRIVYWENAASRMTRTGLTVNCDQTYSNWVQAGSYSFEPSKSFATWLGNGTFQLN